MAVRQPQAGDNYISLIAKNNILRLFAVCDIITFISVVDLLGYYTKNITSSVWLINATVIILIMSLLATAYFNLTKPKLGIKIYYVQFPFRLAFVILTFGFISHLNLLTENGIYKFLLIITTGLELLRLIFNILTHRQINRLMASG